MSFLTLMQNRYTTKNYDATKKIDVQKIQQLKEIVQLSPSSINSQPWKFTFISDKNIKEKLAPISFHNANKVLDCDTVVVFSRIDNLSFFESDISKRLPEGALGYYNQFIKPLSEERIKAWFSKQVYLALGIFLSACAEMGIDATPMEGIEPENYDQVLGAKNYATLLAVAIGYRDKEDFNQPSKKPKSRKEIKTIINSI